MYDYTNQIKYTVMRLEHQYSVAEITNLLLEVIELSISERAVIHTVDMYIIDLYITATYIRFIIIGHRQQIGP